MKTDLTTPGSFLQSQVRKYGQTGKAQPKIPGAPLPLDKKAPSPDYKVDITQQASPSTPSLPSIPSLPSAPSLPTPELKLPDFKPSEVVEEKVKEEVKEEAIEKVKEVPKVEKKEGTQKRPAIIFVKGLDVFSSPSQSERGYAGMGKIADAIKGSRLYGWDQKAEIIKEIKKVEPSQPVILVGHSFGGDTAIEVANELDSLEHKFRKVDLLITMDAIGFNHDVIPQNVKEHLNIFGDKDLFLHDGPHVARRHEMTEVKNILSDLSHTEIDDNKTHQYEIVTMIEKALKRALN